MDGYFLRSDVFHCETDDGIVFLDLVRFRYYAIDRNASTILRDVLLTSTIPKITDGRAYELTNRQLRVAESLVGQGILTTDYALGRRPAVLSVPSVASIELSGRAADEPAIQTKHIVALAISYISTLAKLRWLGLAKLARDVSSRMDKLSRIEIDRRAREVRDLVSVFRRVRPVFYTADKHCLLDSLVLVDFLLRFRISPVLVIGVSPRPFVAHSWVQWNDLVLTDPYEHIRVFTPIFSIGRA